MRAINNKNQDHNLSKIFRKNIQYQKTFNAIVNISTILLMTFDKKRRKNNKSLKASSWIYAFCHIKKYLSKLCVHICLCVCVTISCSNHPSTMKHRQYPYLSHR